MAFDELGLDDDASAKIVLAGREREDVICRGDGGVDGGDVALLHGREPSGFGGGGESLLKIIAFGFDLVD